MMLRIGTIYRRPLAWLMMLLAAITVLSPAVLHADACWDAFSNCVSDLAAYAANPLHWMACLNGLIFCYIYLPA